MVVMSSAVASLSLLALLDPVSFPVFLRLIPFCEIIPSFRLSFATENSS